MDITRVIPCAVPVMLAKRTVLVWPLRLCDIALLQGWLRTVGNPSPLETRRAALALAEGDARVKLLKDAYLRAETWPLRYGSAEGSALFDTEAGRLFFLTVALARATPREACDAEELLHALAPNEWRSLIAAVWGSEPIDELERLLDDGPPIVAGEDLNWGEAFAECAKATGWTFRDIGNLTVSQWIAYRSEGKVTRAARTVPEGMTVMEYAEQRRRAFEGLEADTEAQACAGDGEVWTDIRDIQSASGEVGL